MNEANRVPRARRQGLHTATLPQRNRIEGSAVPLLHRLLRSKLAGILRDLDVFMKGADMGVTHCSSTASLSRTYGRVETMMEHLRCRERRPNAGNE
jgi:hypothetical protein